MSERPGQFGETYYEKVRRFVVINAMEGHCICLSVVSLSCFDEVYLVNITAGPS